MLRDVSVSSSENLLAVNLENQHPNLKDASQYPLKDTASMNALELNDFIQNQFSGIKGLTLTALLYPLEWEHLRKKGGKILDRRPDQESRFTASGRESDKHSPARPVWLRG